MSVISVPSSQRFRVFEYTTKSGSPSRGRRASPCTVTERSSTTIVSVDLVNFMTPLDLLREVILVQSLDQQHGSLILQGSGARQVAPQPPRYCLGAETLLRQQLPPL